jgi:hypothetical protein
MKTVLVLKTDGEDTADLNDMRTIRDAFGRSQNAFCLDDKGLINHVSRTAGTFITDDQLQQLMASFGNARKYYAESALPATVCPRDECKAIVAAIDEALEVLNRWIVKIPGSDRDALAEDFADFYDENAGGDVMEDDLVKYRAADWLRSKLWV